VIDHAVIEERIVVYVLGGMDPIERAAFEAEFEDHRRGCDLCIGLYGDFAQVAAHLALSTPPISPPADLEDRIAALAGGRHQSRASDTSPAGWRRAVAGIAAALALVGGSVAGTLIATRPRVDRVEGGLQLAVMHGFQGNFTLAYVPGSQGALIVSEAPAPPPGRVYQLWLREGGRMVPSGLFHEGARAIQLASSDFDLVAVTEEPDGGSPQPTSEPLASATVP